jgi:ABC-type polysaccharide/polyol phosphate export permease
VSDLATATELQKLGAFFRRDVLVALSYRTALVTEWASLVVQVVVFSYVSKMVNPEQLPTFNGQRVGYLEFVVVGMTLTAFIGVAVARLVSAIRQEQLAGTLESVLITPTHPITVQLGSVAYDLIYVPLRTFGFIFLCAVVFHMDLRLSGLTSSLIVLLVFIPVVWGIGMAVAAATLTFRRATAVTGFGMTAVTLTSGAYFPIGLFPGWVQSLADLNPVGIAVRAMRESLIGGAPFAVIADEVGTLMIVAVVAVALGAGAFRRAIERERRLGTLGLY